MENNLISIMLVDDETFYIDEISQFIDSNIFNVVCTASNGKQALSLFNKYWPQIVIADIEMPYMDGLDLCREIRQVNSQTHLILLTAYDDFNYARRGISNDVDEYILKYELNKAILTEKLLSIADKIYKSESQAIKQLHYLAYSILEDGEQKINNNALSNKYLAKHYYYIVVEADEPLDILSRVHTYSSTNLKQKIELFVHESLSAKFYISLPLNRFLIALDSSSHQCSNSLNSLLNAGQSTCTLYVMSVLHLISDFLYLLNGNSVFQKKRFLGCGNTYNFSNESQECCKDTFVYDPNKIVKLLENGDNDKLQIHLTCLFDSIKESFNVDSLIKTTRSLYHIFERYSQTTNLDEPFPTPVIYDAYSAKEWALNTSYYLINYSQNNYIKRYSPSVKKAIEYIRLNYHDNQLSTERIAEHVYLSTGRLRTLFRQEAETTINKTITQIRIAKAKQLLSTTNLTINDIANQVGFGSQQYFSQIFFSHEGNTPMQYRRENSI